MARHPAAGPARDHWRCPACGDPLPALPADVDPRRTPAQAERDLRALRDALRCSCGLAARVIARP